MEQASEVSVKSFVSGDKFVRESEALHQTFLLQPIQCTERTREVNALNGGEGNKRSANEALSWSVHFNAHSAFFMTVGTVSIARNSLPFSLSIFECKCQ